MPHNTYFNWSSGKDAALAYYHLKLDDRFAIDLLLTTVNGFHDRVSMHGLRRELLVKQAKAIGLPLSIMELPEEPTMDEYELIMNTTVTNLQANDYTHCGFGDIFLVDLRAYRETQLKALGISCQFPLWKRNTTELIHEFIDLGFKAVVVCTKSELLGEEFVGREIDKDFLKDLPTNVDSCGENGEFHTFCYDGPIFKQPIPFEIGEKVFRSYKAPKADDQHSNTKEMGFWFCDLLLN